MNRFEGKNVIVTGAASGIGLETALRIGSEGGRVACLDLNADAAAETAERIGKDGGDALALAVDVSDPEQVRHSVARAADAFGEVHALCNVAGIGGFAHTLEVTLEQWQKPIDVNLTGTFLMCQAALPHLLESRGTIVNTASIAGLRGQAYAAAYCASKAGVVLLTKALAVEFARQGVNVNCVCPGGIETPLIGRGFMPPEGANQHLIMRATSPTMEMAHPSKVANVIAFLASSEADYVNGSAYTVDGATLH